MKHELRPKDRFLKKFPQYKNTKFYQVGYSKCICVVMDNNPYPEEMLPTWFKNSKVKK